MVGIVVVSHSAGLAEGVVELAREMGGPELALIPAGGTDEPGGLGTDAERVRAAIAQAMSPDGVLVLMDLGSALMSAELAVELLSDAPGPVLLSPAPLVEGAVAAAVAARGGGALAEVAEQARGALGMKAAQLGAPPPAPAPAPATAAAPPDAEARVVLANPLGLHARPAARLVAAAHGYDAAVEVARGDGPPAPAASLTAVLALAVRRGDELRVLARGPQAAEAVAALRALAEDGFGELVESTASTPLGVRPGAELPGPAVEAPAPGTVLRGLPAASGLARGPAQPLHPALAPPPRSAGSVPEERARLDGALATAAQAIAADRAAVAARAGESAAAIFDAHRALLEDPALLEPARAAVAAGHSAEQAIDQAARATEERYRGFPDALLRERAADVADVGRRVLAALGSGAGAIAPAGIVIVEELTPGEAAALDPERVSGVATARGTPTAHGAILARALDLPAVVGLGPAILAVPAGTELLLDGGAGTVRVAPPAEELARAEVERQQAAARRRRARAHAGEPARTRDGETIEVRANVASAAEAARAVELGADGVGLLRTEFLYLDRPELPGEDEQVQTLNAVAAALGGRPLVVRTLDAGADKPLPALPMEPEANPFLGLRGIRLTLQRPELLAMQLRALLRVAAEHPVSAMLPMVATVAELEAARELLHQARGQTGIDAPLPLGIMVEVPAAALAAQRLAAVAEFFSIGTNDLTQYTMAAERGDARLGALLSGPQPAVLALVAAAVQGARARGRTVAVCGELAGDPGAALILAGLGVRELSVAPALVAEVKAALRAVDMSALRELAAGALQARDSAAAQALAAALL
jgi:phosphoenolpyruvate-protein phosphotransferase/dihydroxyacetone kinase phosphotransfer subunit